jgi:hypothetical protein
VADDERGLAEAGDDVGHREGLAGAGGAQEAGGGLARAELGGELLDGRGLIAHRHERRDDLEGTRRGHERFYAPARARERAWCGADPR